MEAYAILSWLSVNASLSYLLRGQLRQQAATLRFLLAAYSIQTSPEPA